MAHAQVPPDPSLNPTGSAAASERKQGHLEAGRRRLEEFRKKKAEGKAKKVGQFPKAAVGSLSDGSVFDRGSVFVAETAATNIDQHSGTNGSFKKPDVDSLNEMDSGGCSDDKVQSGIDDKENTSHRSLDFSRHSKGYDDSWKGKANEPRSALSDLVTTSLQGQIDSIQTTPVVDDGSTDMNNHTAYNTGTDRHASNNSFMEYSSTTTNSYNQNSFPTGNFGSNSRPLFLDSINTPHVSSVPIFQPAELVTESTCFRYSNTQEKMGLSQGKDNFASLEQHIEDLTQEKFDLKRALDTSQSLAASLASENSSLTESFNQRGEVVNQLKSDLEQLHEDIRTQLLAFEALKAEYDNAKLEYNAVDDRAKILASEVISLEDKALRLRSNELKLEKQLENSNAEINSCRRKLSSLEKEHCDFRSMIEALQKEKRLFQSMLLRTSQNEDVTESRGACMKKDEFTSTEDLGIFQEIDLTETRPLRDSSEEAAGSSSLSTNLSKETPSSSLDHNNINFLSHTAAKLPSDQSKMIANINSLISELAQEKEELLKVLVAESSMTSKLKDLNKELSQKLEAQTQRFELLAARQIANENVHSRPLDTRNMHGAAEYNDEGDEVVERVLGWIMKLFPGGPTKRRTSKLL